MTIGIIVAMENEKELLSDILQDKSERTENHQTFTEGTMGAHKIILLQSGIGKVAAAVGTIKLINIYHPDYVINSGVAGALHKEVKVMDIVVAEHTTYHDMDCGPGNELGQVQGMPAYFAADERLLRAARQIQSKQTLHFGLICTGDQFISELPALQKIIGNFPQGLAVDMESNAIAQVCYMYKVPFISLRVISDTPGINDHVKQYNNFFDLAPKVLFESVKQILNYELGTESRS